MAKKNLRELYQARYGIKKPLRPYQREAVEFGIAHSNVALLMDPRLGKTRVDIAITGYRFLQGQINKWVVVAPAVAKDVWMTELLDTFAIPISVTTIEGKAEERLLDLKGWKLLPGELNILVINHEATWRLKKALYKSNPQKVSVDESQKIANHASKQSGACHTLARRAQFHTILTGTFLPKPTSAFSQFKFLDPTIFGTKYQDHLDRYVRTYGYGGHKPKTFKNLDEMSEKIASVSYQLTRAQAGGFPDEQYQDIPVHLGKDALYHYGRMEEELKTIVNGREVTAKIVLVQTLRMQQITAGFLPVWNPNDEQEENVEIGGDKIRALRGLLEEYRETEPLVIFVRFKYELNRVMKLCKDVGRSVTWIAGGMKGTQRDDNKHAFQTHKTVDTIVVQVRAGGVAIDLSRADTAIFFHIPQSFIDYEQAKARIIAEGNGKKSILHLVAKGTVDEDAREMLQTRGDLAARILKRYKG